MDFGKPTGLSLLISPTEYLFSADLLLFLTITIRLGCQIPRVVQGDCVGVRIHSFYLQIMKSGGSNLINYRLSRPSMAGELGFEPRLTVLETEVLPITPFSYIRVTGSNL